MAHQQILITGTAGPVTMYVRNGKQFIRSKPTKVKQAAATKKRSANFAIASRSARITGDYFHDVFSYKDGTRFIRLTGAYSRWLAAGNIADKPAGPMEYLENFAINPPKMIGSKWRNNITVSRNSNGLHISINDLYAKDMMAIPKDTNVIRLTITSMLMHLGVKELSQNATTAFSIPYDGLLSAIEVQHNLAIASNCILLTGFAVECVDRYGSPVKLRKGYTLPAEMVYGEWMGM